MAHWGGDIRRMVRALGTPRLGSTEAMLRVLVLLLPLVALPS